MSAQEESIVILSKTLSMSVEEERFASLSSVLSKVLYRQLRTSNKRNFIIQYLHKQTILHIDKTFSALKLTFIYRFSSTDAG